MKGEGKSRLRRALHALPPVLAVLALVHPVARALARYDWRMDLLSHFQEAAFILTVVAAVAMLLSHRSRLVVPLLLLAGFQAEPIVRFSLPNPVKPAAPDGPKLRIFMANVLVNNRNYEGLASLIRETDPDIVCLVEYSDDWLEGLAEVAERYPHRMNAPDGARGLALWFKKPAISVDLPALASPGGWPYLRATFSFAGEIRRLWLIHPASPLRRWGRERGFPDLESLGRKVAEDVGSTIVLGDFNTTDGSPFLRDFLATTGLRDSRLGFGRQPSWPVGSPVQITIDHAFVSDDLAVVARTQGPSIGSDHRPFWFDVTPAASPAKTRPARAVASDR